MCVDNEDEEEKNPIQRRFECVLCWSVVVRLARRLRLRRIECPWCPSFRFLYGLQNGTSVGRGEKGTLTGTQDDEDEESQDEWADSERILLALHVFCLRQRVGGWGK